MTKMKLFSSVLLVLAVLFAQVGTVAAAPQTQDGTITVTGTVTAIGEPQTDANGVTTVPVTITDANGVETTVLVSEADAAGLTVGQKDVTLTGTTSDTVPPEEDVHPISALLADFFDVDASVIDSFHTGDNEAEQVFGFGVIAQALWMATDSEGETSTTDLELAAAILEAKKSGDYSEVAELLGWEDGDEIPTNWGQFKKALKDKHENLGAAHADDDENGQGKEKKPKKNKQHGNPHNNP